MATQVARARWGFAETTYLAVIVGSLTLLTVLFGSIYYVAEWRAMTQDCRAHGQNQGVDYSHSWTHGFTCTSSDGHQQSQFWW